MVEEIGLLNNFLIFFKIYPYSITTIIKKARNNIFWIPDPASAGVTLARIYF